MLSKKMGFCWCIRGHRPPEIKYNMDNGNGGLTLKPLAMDTPMPSDLEEVNRLFAECVDELDLDQSHRDAMFSLPPEKKWHIYCSKKKEREDPSATSWPDYYIERVGAMNNVFFPENMDEEMKSREKLVEDLKSALRTQPMRFVTRFIELDGLQTVLDFLEKMDNKLFESPIHTQAIGCIKALMNNSYGRSHVLAHPRCINIIAQSMGSENPRTKTAVFEIMGAVCLVPGGHRKVLEAMIHYKDYASERTRFQTLINDLDRKYPDDQDEILLKMAIMSFINAALKYGPGQDHLEFRLHLRYEFLMLGIMPIIDKMRLIDSETLTRHLDFFEMIRNEDEREISKRYDSNHIDSKSASNMLDLLKKKLGHTLAYPHLLSLLFHLLQLPEGNMQMQYWQLIDRIVQQISIQHNGNDPDGDAPLDINVKQIVRQLVSENEMKAIQHKMREIQKESDDVAKNLAKKEHECEVKNEELEELMCTVNKMKSKYEQEAAMHGQTKQQLAELSHQYNELASMLEAERGERLKLENMVKTGSLPDDAKLHLKGSSLPVKKIPTIAPAAPPGPPVGGAPPPPPPPAPPGNVPPPPPCAPGVPPPPGGPFAPGTAMKQKNIPKPSNPLKSFNWAKLPENKVRETLWADIDDTKLFKALDLAEFDRTFSAYQKHHAEDDDGLKTLSKKAKELSVIDGRRAQNCTILLSKLKMTNSEISRAVMAMDDQEELPKDMCEQLLKFVPTPEETQMLQEHEKEIDEMARADRFMFDMSKIVHYEQRLKALYFKKKFSERLAEVKPKVESVLKASKEVVVSRRLKKLLEIVLAYGNYMNRGQRGNAYGFRLSSLNKIIDTKSSNDKKVTLLHYLIQVLENKFPDVMKIDVDLANVSTAAKVNMTELEAEINVLRVGLNDIHKELDFYRNRPYVKGDKFVSTMNNFKTVASINFSELEDLFGDMKQKYEKAQKTFGEEGKKQPEEFFGEFDQFLQSFTEAQKQNKFFKKMEEEAQKRAQMEEKMRAERAKKMQDKGKNGVQPQQQSGEFDDLISALRTGDVFNEDLAKMKRNRRRGSNQQANESRERMGNLKNKLR